MSNVDLYLHRYNMLLETVRVFANTLDQEYGSLLGGSTKPSIIIWEHHSHHPSDTTRIAVELAKQLAELKSIIEKSDWFEEYKKLQYEI